MYDMKISVQGTINDKRSGGWVSNIQVVHRQAMRLNGCFPKNTIYIYIQYLEPDRDNVIWG